MNDELPPPGDAGASDAPLAPTPRLDIEKYREHMDGLDLTEVEQEELLRTLWWIMASFVQLGFGVDSVQSVLPAFAEASSPVPLNGVDKLEGSPEAGGISAASGKAIHHEP